MPDCRLTEVRCREEDARLVFEWRNDPVTREGSFHTGALDWADFWPVFRDTYPPAGQPRPQFVVEAGRPVAFLRFDAPRTGETGSEGLVEVSINVAPEARGRGVGVAALLLAEDYIRGFGYPGILALVKVENAISRHVFEKAGYRAGGEVTVDPGGGEAASRSIRYLRRLDAAEPVRRRDKQVR